jgi:hypothetical protein
MSHALSSTQVNKGEYDTIFLLGEIKPLSRSLSGSSQVNKVEQDYTF